MRRPCRRSPVSGCGTPRPVLVAAVALALVLAGVGCGTDDDRDLGSGTTAPGPATSSGGACPSGPPEALVPEVVRELPHDPEAFTQGLVVLDGVLYESTGLEGSSSLRALDPDTGQELRRVELAPELFAEGLAQGDDGHLVQLTWKDGRALVWDRVSFAQVGEFAYTGEGWGLTTLDDGTLVMSDGSDELVQRDPADFGETDRWRVQRDGGPTDQLNELEWDGTHLWANRWQTDEILRIDPACRRVDGVVDASALAADAAATSSAPGDDDVLNGIAHLPGTDRFLVTGKLWPTLFEVRFVPA